jgi:hypothetical protein
MMSRHRELFILAGVVAVDPDLVRRDSFDAAMHQIEQAGRDAVRDTDQKLIDARVTPPDDDAAVIVSIRF